MNVLKGRTSISYSRFSSVIQKKGDSLRRQQEIYKAIVTHHEMVDVGHSFIDEGKSAFKGKHLDSELGSLLELLVDSKFKFKPVLVIEKWDRLSRLDMNDTIDLFRKVVAVADILDASDGQVYTSESMNNIANYMTVGIKAYQAHMYSKNLSDRLRAVNKTKTINASQGVISGRNYPRWLEVENSEFKLVPHRVATIQKMYELKENGMGTRSIANYLNENEHKTWTNFGRENNKIWIHGTVRAHLKNIAATGILKNKDIIQADYYPRIVSDELFNTVQASFKTQKQNGFNTMKRNGQNLLYNVRCMACNNKMTFNFNRDNPIYVCSYQKQCRNGSIKYKMIENIVCDFVFGYADLSSPKVIQDDNSNERLKLESEIQILQEHHDKNEAQGKRTSAIIMVELAELQHKLEELQPLTIEQVSQPKEHWFDLLKGSPDVRLRLAKYLNSVVEHIEILSKSRKEKLLVIAMDNERYVIPITVHIRKGFEYLPLNANKKVFTKRDVLTSN